MRACVHSSTGARLLGMAFTCDCMGASAWMHGCMLAWMHGSLNAWMHGCMNVACMFVCMDAWI